MVVNAEVIQGELDYSKIYDGPDIRMESWAGATFEQKREDDMGLSTLCGVLVQLLREKLKDF